MFLGRTAEAGCRENGRGERWEGFCHAPLVGGVLGVMYFFQKSSMISWDVFRGAIVAWFSVSVWFQCVDADSSHSTGRFAQTARYSTITMQYNPTMVTELRKSFLTRSNAKLNFRQRSQT
jgi:hypothetical protein